jgi:hypothetical protein
MAGVLTELYQQQLDLFRRLGKLSTSMAGFAPDQLMGDDTAGEGFLRLVDERAVIMGQIDQLSEQIDSLEGEGESPEVGLLKRALQEEMAKIQEKNEVIEEVVKKALEELRQEAKKLQSGKQSNRAYIGSFRSAEGAYIDKRR